MKTLKKKMLEIIFLFLTVTSTILASKSDLCGYDLLNECKLIKVKETLQFESEKYICPRLDLKPKFVFRDEYRNCTKGSFNIYFNLHKPTIIDGSFNLEMIDEISQYLKYSTSVRFYYMRNIQGFDINYNLYPIINYIEMHFFDTRFEFYSNGNLIRSCNDLAPDVKPMSIFRNIMSFGTMLYFKTVQFTTRICPLLFQDMPEINLNFDILFDTFYKRNVLEFHDLKNITDINAYVKSVFFYNIEKVEFNSILLNNLVFKNINMIGIYGEVKSIQIGLFRSFKSFNFLVMDPFFLRALFHRGTDWIRDLNSDVLADHENKSQIDSLMNMHKYFIFTIDTSQNMMSTYLNRDFLNADVIFPDEDLCLYEHFPFNQLVIFSISNRKLVFGLNATFSCTYIWLTQYYDLYSKYIYDFNLSMNRMNLRQEIEKCDFNKKFEYCSKIQYRKISSINDVREVMILLDFILMVLTPVICLLGLVSNILVIKTVKSNIKELKENQYKYMALNAASNTLILLIQSISLISECQRFNGIFCSRVNKSAFAQFFKIIFEEYLTSFLVLFSNLTYMGFAINRLSLVGKNHGKLTVYASNLTLGQFITRIFLPCLSLPVVKIFKFIPNFDQPEDEYPHPFVYFFNKISREKSYAFFAFNILFDLINSFGFLVINLIIDILLAVKLKQVIEEKGKNSSASKAKSEENKKSGKDSVNRVIKMVILNATIGVVLKALLAYSPINDFINSIQYIKVNPADYTFRDAIFGIVPLCSYEATCHTIEKLANLLYLVSLSILLLFYRSFDKNFDIMLKKTLFNSKK